MYRVLVGLLYQAARNPFPAHTSDVRKQAQAVDAMLLRRQQMAAQASRDTLRKIGTGSVGSGGGLVGNHPVTRERQAAEAAWWQVE
jgi:hypothetical protein